MVRSLAAAARTRLRNLRYSYLFLPGVLAVGFAALAAAATALDRQGGQDGVLELFPAGPPAARSVLGTIAASLITVAGVAFSITIVSLQLVSQQFTPRALRNFLGDRLNQTVAGVFIGVFLYCLIVLRSVEETDSTFVPGLGVTLGLALAIGALGMLLVFIHHMAHSIQVSNIAADIARRTLRTVDGLYPDGHGEPLPDDPDELVARWQAERAPLLVFPDRPGFVQSVEGVPAAIGGRGFRVRLHVAPGDLVTERHPLAAVWPSRESDGCNVAVRRALAIADERDLERDTGYGVRQLTDIAIKALSPSVNDPTTATTCIGYLQAVLERLAARPWPSRVRHFPERDVTLVVRRESVDDYLESLVQVARYAGADARVVEALLRAAHRVAEAADAASSTEWAAAARSSGRRIARRALAHATLDAEERARVEELAGELEAQTAARAAPS